MNARGLLQARIWTYQHRRQRARELYGLGTEKYKKMSRNTTLKITYCKRKMDRIDRITEKLEAIDRRMVDFLGISVHLNGKSKDKRVCTARNLFYKYCLENGITGNHVAVFCGLTAKKQPCEQRLCFTRSFDRRPENREMWHQFNAYMRRNPIKIRGSLKSNT